MTKCTDIRIITKHYCFTEKKCLYPDIYIKGMKWSQLSLSLDGPDDMMLSPASTSYIRYEQESLNVTCSAECWPQCDYGWTGPNSFLSKSNELQLNGLLRNESGQYVCTATNSILNRTQQTGITVNIHCKYNSLM